jgi:hypothetical protein
MEKKEGGRVRKRSIDVLLSSLLDMVRQPQKAQYGKEGGLNNTCHDNGVLSSCPVSVDFDVRREYRVLFILLFHFEGRNGGP